MPYVYEDPIMSGQNPFARPVPVSTGMSDMTRPMPVRPGSGQAVNTQGQSGIGPGGRPSVDYLPGVERPAVSPEDLVVRPGTNEVTEVAAPSDSQILQEQLQAIDDREQIGQTITVPMDSAPVAGGSASPMFGAGGFEFIGLVAIGALIYYMARA
jgi:hypothetical protein